MTKPDKPDKPQAEVIRDHLAKCISAAYGTRVSLISGDARKALWSFIRGAEEDGDDVRRECRRYVDWLEYATRSDSHQKAQHPPQTAEKACIDIAIHYGKACAWSKFKSAKASLLKPLPNPHLADERPPESIPSDDEMREFLAQMRRAVAGIGQEVQR